MIGATTSQSPDYSFSGFGRMTVTDFQKGEDHVGDITLRLFDRNEVVLGFDQLDSNDDARVGAGDVGVTVRAGTLEIDVATIYHALDADSPFRGASSIRLIGVSDLQATDFSA